MVTNKNNSISLVPPVLLLHGLTITLLSSTREDLPAGPSDEHQHRHVGPAGEESHPDGQHKLLQPPGGGLWAQQSARLPHTLQVPPAPLVPTQSLSCHLPQVVRGVKPHTQTHTGSITYSLHGSEGASEFALFTPMGTERCPRATASQCTLDLNRTNPSPPFRPPASKATHQKTVKAFYFLIAVWDRERTSTNMEKKAL